MFRSFLYVIIACGFLNSETCIAQTASRTKARYPVRAPGMRGDKAIFENSSFPYHGLGLKVGDPFAVSYKFYPNRKISFALDFGKAASGLYSRYFREQFASYISADTFSSIDASMQYLAHRTKSDFVGEFKVMFHLDARKISPGLQVYLGGGWEWKTTHLEYTYLYHSGSPDPMEPETFGRFQRHRFTMGPQVLAGIEYAYFQIPISAFMELEYFTDILVDPGWKRFEGGIGLRYIF